MALRCIFHILFFHKIKQLRTDLMNWKIVIRWMRCMRMVEVNCDCKQHSLCSVRFARFECGIGYWIWIYARYTHRISRFQSIWNRGLLSDYISHFCWRGSTLPKWCISVVIEMSQLRASSVECTLHTVDKYGIVCPDNPLSHMTHVQSDLVQLWWTPTDLVSAAAIVWN